ncbi:MAG TPA: hypothetical protein VN457_07410, partial [Chlamydiales bacterium]|nr:hypothetical protein [Chlamydiales bacterium]
FSSSLEQASKQAFEVLKQRIETSLFNPALESWVVEQMGGKKETASLIDTVVHAIDKEGIKSDLAVKIAARFTPDEIAAALSKQILEQLKNGAIEVGDQKAGIKVLIKAKRMMLEVTDASLKELIASFIRKDFRRVFFA